MTKKIDINTVIEALLDQYDIPRVADINRLVGALDRLEKAIRQDTRPPVQGNKQTASMDVLNFIKSRKKAGACFAEIHKHTGFNEKKVRNIIFRLNNLNQIQRKERGFYVVLPPQ